MKSKQKYTHAHLITLGTKDTKTAWVVVTLSISFLLSQIFCRDIEHIILTNLLFLFLELLHFGGKIMLLILRQRNYIIYEQNLVILSKRTYHDNHVSKDFVEIHQYF